METIADRLRYFAGLLAAARGQELDGWTEHDLTNAVAWAHFVEKAAAAAAAASPRAEQELAAMWAAAATGGGLPTELAALRAARR